MGDEVEVAVCTVGKVVVGEVGAAIHNREGQYTSGGRTAGEEGRKGEKESKTHPEIITSSSTP